MTREELENACDAYCQRGQSEDGREWFWQEDEDPKYIKIFAKWRTLGTEAIGFVQIEDSPEWKAGTVFKPATFNYPQLKPKFSDQPQTSVVLTFLYE